MKPRFPLRPIACLAALLLPAGLLRAATVDVQVNGQDGKPLLEAVVYLESAAARAASRARTGLEIEQRDKRFVQRVAVVPLGSAVNFPNRDKVRHHVYSLSPAKPFELKLYSGVPANPVVFDRPGVAVLGCNIHDQMVAWVVVVETPHHGLAGADGRVRLDDVPPGSYRLKVWHPGLPPGAAALDQALVVAGDKASATVVLPMSGGGL
jgi:plastocyanin